jgi:hypothetical protein
MFKMWQNLAPFDGRPTSGAIEALLMIVEIDNCHNRQLVLFLLLPLA